MKILIDCRYVRPAHHDGISRFTVGIVRELTRLHPGVELLVCDERQLSVLPDVPRHRVSSPTSIWEPLVARQVRRIKADVVFSPMQTMGSWGRDYALVLTLHDLIYHHYPTPPPEFALPIRMLWRLYHRTWSPQRMLLNRADAVVTVSETTAALIEQHRLTHRLVTVVPNAPDVVPGVPRTPRTGALVYMGSFMPYKNVGTLAGAMTALAHHELHLMSPVSREERVRLSARSPGGTLVFHDGASDETYRDVLRGATALVSASRDEGFGIPLVEAMALGTPLVVSDIPVFREVGGDAAAYVDPDDGPGFVRAVRELDDPEIWQQRSAAARARSRDYTWQASAQILLTLLERTTLARTSNSPRP